LDFDEILSDFRPKGAIYTAEQRFFYFLYYIICEAALRRLRKLSLGWPPLAGNLSESTQNLTKYNILGVELFTFGLSYSQHY